MSSVRKLRSGSPCPASIVRAYRRPAALRASEFMNAAMVSRSACH